ncbi:MAG: FecR family protein [Thermodesulfobacteriota bacterium]
MRSKTLSAVCILLPAVFLLSILPALAGDAPEKKAPARITFLTGDASVAAEGKEPVPAKLSMEVRTGDTVATGADSRCEVTLMDGSILRMGENGSHKIARADFKEKKASVAVFSRAGRIWAKVSKTMDKNREFSVGTDKAVCAVRGTVFNVSTDSGQTDISVFEGKVAAAPALPAAGLSSPGKVSAPSSVPGPHAVTMARWVEIVSAMQRLVVKNDGTYSRSDITEDQVREDPWVKWNRERDVAAEE